MCDFIHAIRENPGRTFRCVPSIALLAVTRRLAAERGLARHYAAFVSTDDGAIAASGNGFA
jgi:hypothetical protein